MFYNFLVLSSKSKKPSNRRGFGLVELLVSISIITIVMAIVFTRQSSFNGAVLLRGEAYKVALTLRDIQLSAVSASFASTTGSGTFRSVLGAHFDDDPLNNSEYKIFRDADADFYHDSVEEFGLQGILDKRFEIRDIRAGTAGNPPTVSIVFERPDFDARFFAGSGLVNEITGEDIEIVIARVGSSGTGPGDMRIVEITPTGQISVK